MTQAGDHLNRNLVLANIPAFPPIVLRVLDLLSVEQPDTARLVQEISADPTLSAQVLRLANSPLFGLAQQVHSVQRAVFLLGLARVQSLIMAVATTNYMRAALRTEALDKCWRHTTATAILSRELARAAGQSPERAYTLGLLHDIGRLGLLVAYPDAYGRILKVADRDAVSLLDQEKYLFGLDHCEAGRLLLAEWKLPQDFCLVVGRHHDPPSAESFDWLTIGYVACQMADTLGYSVVKPLKPLAFAELRAMLPRGVQERFPAEPEALVEMINRAVGESDPALDVPSLDDRQEEPVESPAGNREMFSASRSDLRHDLTVTLITAIAFAVVLIGCRLFLGL